MDKFFLPLHGMLKKDIEILDKNIITIFEQIKTDIFQTRGKVLSDANREFVLKNAGIYGSVRR